MAKWLKWNIRVEHEVVFLLLGLLWGLSEDVLYLDNYAMLFCFFKYWRAVFVAVHFRIECTSNRSISPSLSGLTERVKASVSNSTPKQEITVEGWHEFSEDSCKPREDKSLSAWNPCVRSKPVIRHVIVQIIKHQTALLWCDPGNGWSRALARHSCRAQSHRENGVEIKMVVPSVS